MKEIFTKALLSGLGLASLTKDAIQKTAEDLVDQSKLSEDEGRRIVKDLHKRSSHVQKAIETKIARSVNQVLKQLNMEIIKIPKKAAKSAGRQPAKKGPHEGHRPR